MKNWLIKLLGGYTCDEVLCMKKEHLRDVTNQLNALKELAARYGITL